MTDEQKKAELLKWARTWCKNPDLPETDVLLFLDQAMEVLSTSSVVKSESLSRWSATYKDNPLLELAKQYLPLKRMRTL